MATVTATPADMTITLGYFTTSKDGTISWTTPTVPSGSTITSVKLTGTVTASNSSITSITLNGQSLTVSTSGASFTIDLGTDNSKTSLSATAKKSNSFSNYNVKFTNMVYTVEYKEESYTVIFKNEDGSIIKTVNDVAKGETIRYIAPDISKDGYSFIGWVSESDPNGYIITSVNSDLTLIPRFERNPTLIIIQNEGGYFTYNNIKYEGNQTFNLDYRDTFELDVNTNEGYGIAYYTFKYSTATNDFKDIRGSSSGFNLSLDMTTDCTVVIKYEKLDSKFTVNFKDYDGTTIKTINDVVFGTSVFSIKPDNPVRAGYKFTGWSEDIGYHIIEDITFVAEYVEGLTISIIQNHGGYFIYNDKKYEGNTILDFTDIGMIDADLQFYCNEGYYFAYTHQIDIGNNVGFDEEESGTNSSFSQEWQGITESQVFKVEYARISSINKENIIIGGQFIKEAYLGNKSIRIYRSDDRII